MTLSIILSMIALSFAMSISPGPVNILIISSGINHGFKKTFAFVSGATIGFTLLLIFVGFGFIATLEKYPLILKVLSIFGSIFIIYMGYKIAISSIELNCEDKSAKKLKFYEGFLLQWLNPKAWVVTVAGVSLYSSSNTELIVFIGIYFIICYSSLSFWAFFGDKGSLLLSKPKRLKTFNILMGGLLVLSALSILAGEFL